jgi:hypothetical protein
MQSAQHHLARPAASLFPCVPVRRACPLRLARAIHQRCVASFAGHQVTRAKAVSPPSSVTAAPCAVPGLRYTASLVKLLFSTPEPSFTMPRLLLLSLSLVAEDDCAATSDRAKVAPSSPCAGRHAGAHSHT